MRIPFFLNAALTISFILPLFSQFEGVQLPAQLAALLFLWFSAFICLNLRQRTKNLIDAGGFVLVGTGVLSLLVSTANDLDYSFFYSIVFIATVVSSEIILSRVDRVTLFNSVCRAYVAMMALIVMTYPSDFISALRGDRFYGIGLQRFSPFDLHPNTTGFIFGAGFLCLLFKALSSQGRERWFYFASTLGAISVVLAASARAGIVSGVAALLIWGGRFISKYWRRIGSKIIRFSPLLAWISLVLILFFSEKFIAYLINILDLQSDTRGIGSGGTGRVELWQEGWNLILEQGFTLLTGNGFRFASPEIIGFSTESSYITIVLENGLVATAAILWLFHFSIRVYGKYASEQKAMFVIDEALYALCFFALIQSIFNRYLLAVGNTFSLYIIFIVLTTFKTERLVRANRKAAPRLPMRPISSRFPNSDIEFRN